jgi:hypothetical protein
MAATVTVTRTINPRDVPDDYVVDIAETAIGVATTTTIDPDAPETVDTGVRLPRRGRIYEQSSILTSGAGTTVDPELNDDAAAPRAIVKPSGSAAAQVQQVLEPRRYDLGDSGSFVHKSNPDAGADNVVSTRYLIREDWEDNAVARA